MIDHIGDILAIPFFAWLSFYYYRIPNRTNEENILLAFSVGGLVADLIFTTNFLRVLRRFLINAVVLIYFVVVFIAYYVVYQAPKLIHFI